MTYKMDFADYKEEYLELNLDDIFNEKWIH
jgi:hypothetical protein